MTNWTSKQKSENDLMNSFSTKVKVYLGIKDGFSSGDLARWLFDSYQLVNTDWPNTYSDYSFIVVPASKALENWIFKIAKDLGVRANTNHIGVVRDQIESHLNTISNSVEKKLGDSINTDITYLKNFIQEYRNDIVHYEKKIKNATLAKSKVFVIYEHMNSVTKKLIIAKVIKVED